VTPHGEHHLDIGNIHQPMNLGGSIMSQIETLEARKAEIETELDTLITLAETEARAISDEETVTQDALVEEHRSVVEKIVKAKAAEEVRAQRGATLTAVNGVPAATTELRTEPYRKGGKESYFKDLADASKGVRAAVDRLTENDRHRVDMEKRAGTTTVAGAGGEFAPPLWQINEFVALARPGRPVADLVNKIVLPAGVASVSLPKITTGTATGVQGTQNTAITSQDIVTTSVTTGITTLAGGVVVSRQILDQSPVSMDEIILQDLARDLAQKVDLATITAIVAAAGNTITYTDATPTTAKLIPFIQQAIDQIGLGIYTPNQIVAILRTDRWGRFVAAADSTGRPLVLPNANYGAFNARGVQENATTGQGYVGTINSIPVVTDAQVPNNLGAGTNQDEIVVFDPTQVYLYESTPQAEAFEQTFANTMSVYCRMFEYYGIIANRLPKAISTVTGTGLIPYTYGS
jgi:HK97 family phage major capsid protein